MEVFGLHKWIGLLWHVSIPFLHGIGMEEWENGKSVLNRDIYCGVESCNIILGRAYNREGSRFYLYLKDRNCREIQNCRKEWKATVQSTMSLT